MKIRNRTKINPVYLVPGDTFELTITDPDTGKTKTVSSEDIGRAMQVDEVATFDIEGEFGFIAGIGGIFGESQK